MKFVVIFGPAAVGKMTVGFELARLTGFRLFHNHQTIDLVLNFFEFDDPAFNRLVGEFRRRIFEEVSVSQLPGLIFTFVWALDLEADQKFIDRSAALFSEKGGDVYFVELEADLSERLKRNESEFRLSQKAPKRNLAASRAKLLEHEEKYRFNSSSGGSDFFYRENYLKINNTDLSPEQAALLIAERFGFAKNDNFKTDER